MRVYYEDTDAAGLVYYANYLHFIERARTERLRALGFDQGALMRDFGIAFVVRRAELDFLAPARLDDVLEVDAGLAAVSHVTIDFLQRVMRAGTLLVQAKVKVACVNIQTMKPARIPAPIRQELDG